MKMIVLQKAQKILNSRYSLHLVVLFTLIFSILILSIQNKASVSNITLQTKHHVNFIENFEGSYVLEESGDMTNSASNDWWLNSGAYLFYVDGIATTQLGPLEEKNRWVNAYKNSNSDSTRDGYYPQNIFRLITRSKWQNFEQELEFEILENNLIDAEHRNESNGVLLFMRYLDSDNLYYAGVRVDGNYAIKRKRDGQYETLAIKPFTNQLYVRDVSDEEGKQSLIETNQKIFLKTSIKNNEQGYVEIKLYAKDSIDQHWTEVLSAIDKSSLAIRESAYAGIRGDFMDLKFYRYSARVL